MAKSTTLPVKRPRKSTRLTPTRPATRRPSGSAATQHAGRGAARRGGEQEELDLIMKLLPIEARSGDEAAVARFIQQQLINAGAPVSAIQFDTAHRQTPTPGNVGNLILKLPGTTRGPRRLLMSHMDTVPICVGCKPVIQGRFVRSANPRTGLGADNRAGVAVTLLAALRILREKPDHPPLTFVWTVQEEIGLFGARYIKTGLLGKPALAFNWDGGSPAKITIGATGGYRMAIRVNGIASHAGNAPQQGVSAIAIASLAIADLQTNGWHGLVVKNGKRGTTNVGIIQGGDATNVVTDEVFVRAEARSHNSKFRRVIVQQMEKAFQRAARQVKNSQGKVGSVQIEGRLDYESFRLADDEACVVAAQRAAMRCQVQPILNVTNGGVDANWMVLHGIPTVTLGCGQVNPHMLTEALDIEHYHQACRIAWILATATENLETE